MRVLSFLAACGYCLSVARGAPALPAAHDVVGRIQHRGVVRCGSVERPGLAQRLPNGPWGGLTVDVCRAIAAAVLSHPDRIEYHSYETPRDFDAVREARDDVYFLTGSEVSEQKLAGVVLPVATVFVESHAVAVPARSGAQHVRDLSGNIICFLIGSSAERSLADYFDNLKLGYLRAPFSETGEMDDAYNVGRCRAIAGEITRLATIASPLDPHVKRVSSRILPEQLAAFPVLAATGTTDARWSSIVAWTVHTLVSAERPQTRWYAGGARAMPIAASELGLDPEWQRRVLAAVGNYGEVFERHLGKRSPLGLERGLNANQLHGGLILSPFLD